MTRNLFHSINLENITDNDHVKVKVEKVSRKNIAVVGMGVKLPLADQVEQFWNNLKNGVDCIRRIPESRKSDLDLYFNYMDTNHPQDRYGEAAYLEEIDKFDYKFFRLSPKEASLMDPHQRVFLETAWSAIEDAGYGGQNLVGTRTGVYVGFSGEYDYKKLITDVSPASLSLAVPGNLSPIIASRISYLLDLRGPSLLVNTVCSSSLVAVHIACMSLRNGECDLAMAGGVQLYVFPFRQAVVGIESSDFRTRSFDHSSDGTGAGEGVGVVLLKPLTEAVKDRDHIYAVIKGSAVNQDGRSISISAPNPAAQEDVVVRAWQDAGIDPETITYIEAHGTGTKLGDPIEIEALNRAFNRYTDKKQFCAIGSVKSNMGHLDSSAGIAGLIKAVLALYHKQIPPSLHFERPNRKIPFHDSPVYINNMLEKWETHGCPHRCGVSSFSFSGTNSHLILEEAPEIEQSEDSAPKGPELFTISARTEAALNKLVHQYRKIAINSQSCMHDICYTANAGRGHYEHRLAILSGNKAELAKKLEIAAVEFKSPRQDDGIYYGCHRVIAADRSPDESKAEEITTEQVREISRNVSERVRKFHRGIPVERDWQRIAQLYVKGAEIDWDEWYRGSKARRVPLPTYPFASSRCWLPIPLTRDQDTQYYALNWKKEVLEEKDGEFSGGSVLILKDARGVGNAIVHTLRGEQRRVIEVEPGDTFSKISPDNYSLAGTPEDYEKLLNEPILDNVGMVIYLHSSTDFSDIGTTAELEKRLESSIYHFFYLMQSLLKKNVEDVEIILISECLHEVNGREKRINPEASTIMGLGKVVNVENFNWKCRFIDMDETTTVSHIVKEIKAGYRDYKVAFRNNHRYVEEMIPVNLDKIPDKELNIKSEGVYVITGGTGGLGLEIAGYLAAQNQVNLALIGRTSIPVPGETPDEHLHEGGYGLKSKREAIERIENSGSRVIGCQADVSRESEITEVINTLRQRFGKINGLIHCAGVGTGRQGDKVKDDSGQVYREVLAPKVQGTWILDKITRQDDLDFFVVFSSPITLVGGVGSGSYAAANTFLDSFAAYRNRLGHRTISMSWAPWENTLKRMSIPFDPGRHLFEPLTTLAIINAFDQILRKDIPAVVIGKLNLSSDIFYLGNRLPLRFDNGIRHRVESTSLKADDPFETWENADSPPIGLTGRSDRQYTANERCVAQTFGRLLGYHEIDIHDNFYELGGDSIIAAKIVHAVNKKAEADAAVEELLKYPSVFEFARILDGKNGRGIGKNSGYSSIPCLERRDYYLLSSVQKRMYFLQAMNPGSTAYNISSAYLVNGAINTQRVENIFKSITGRHESLRTSFHLVNGFPVQRIHESVDFRIECDDAPSAPSTKGTGEPPAGKLSREIIIRNYIRPFDLKKAPLLRVGWITTGKEEQLFVLDTHHIISDGVSMGLILDNFVQYYNRKELPGLRVQYKDFSRWQHRWIKSDHFTEQESYWLEEFSEAVPRSTLPVDYKRPRLQSFAGDTVYFTVEENKTKLLKKLAGRGDTTLFTLLLALYTVMLAKISGQEEMTIGIPTRGRRHPDLQPIIGMFLNTLPVRSRPCGDKRFAELLTEIKNTLLRSFENQDYPFEELVDKLGLPRDPSRNPIFDTMFIFQNIAIPDIHIPGVKIDPYEYKRKSSMVDLTLIGEEVNGRLTFRFEYCTRLFKEGTIGKIIEIFSVILNIVTENANIKIRDINIEAEIGKANKQKTQTNGKSSFNEVEFNI